MAETRTTYCRICPAHCGIEVEVTDSVVTRVVGDRAHPLTRGFTCAKGRCIGDLHAAPDRLLESQRREPDGNFEPIGALSAIDEIAGRLRSIISTHGPNSVAVFVGTQTYTASLTYSFLSAWFRAVGSQKQFTTVTIDQSAKIVTAGRLGSWAGGRQRFQDADVWMLVGTNPLVSMQGGDITGFPIHDGSRALKEARRRGLKLIVVDPRRSQVAAHADLHLQIRPGTDAALMAGLHQVILEEGLLDEAFCRRWVSGVDALREAVSRFTPDVVALITGIDPMLIVEAARTFGAARSGMATSGTGPDMGPHANVAEHLVQALNVVCGRFPREGERPAGRPVLEPNPRYREEARSPSRPWERSPKNRFGVAWLGRELMSPMLPDEVLLDGPDRIRALVVAGGNPGAAFPDQDRILDTLDALELLVVLDPFMTETARRAHYVIAPTLSLERTEDTRGYGQFTDQPFAQVAAPVLTRPPGTIHDWEFFLRLGRAMGLTLKMGRRTYGPEDPVPTDAEVLAARAEGGYVDYAEVQRHPRGRIFADVPTPVVAPTPDGADGRFELMPADVEGELRNAHDHFSSSETNGRLYRLIVRRSRETMNSLGRRVPGLVRHGYNPCYMHPDDMQAANLDPGAVVEITSDHGTVGAIVQPDRTLRRGVLSMTHCFGGEPGLEEDVHRFGTNPTRLLSLQTDLQPISLMPLMTAVPVSLTPAGLGSTLSVDDHEPRDFMRKLSNIACCLFLVCACACDTVRLAADSSAELFARAQPAFEQYFDYETAGKAAPAGIIQLEGILRIVPENERILLMTIGAYLGYGVGWIEDRLEEADAADDFEQMVHLRGRLRLMYTRAWDLGKHALRLRADGFDDAVAGGVDSLSSWLEKNFDQPEDAEILLFAAQAWAAKIIQSLDDIDSVADFPLAKVVLERSVELDPSFYFMQGKMFLALVAAQQFPPDMEKSRKLFDEVLAQTERRSLIVQVSMARYYAVAIGDYALFKSLLEEVLAAGDVLPEARLTNVVARRRAERYLRLAHLFFSDVEETRP